MIIFHFLRLEEFINESKHLNHKMDFPFGNRSVTFDKVIAFDHNYTGYYKMENQVF